MSGYSVTPPQARPVRSRPLASPSSAAPLNRAASASARPYYDAVVSDLCTLETFQTNFNTNDFVAQLTSKLVQRSRADPGPFNPRPFIRTFESALEQLVQIRSQVDAQSQQLSSSVHVAESAYTKKLDELGKNFAAVGNSFNSLEDRISEVGRTAIRIGEQLETIDKQRNRASEAHDLIEFYYMFARGDTSKLERLRKEGGREGRMKTAVIARRLAAISREVDVVGSEQTRDAIDRYCERFERDMLKLFDKFYRRSDPKMMSHIAKVLQGFNGGASCVQIYVNQHDFFISKDRVGEANSIELSEIWTHMADPDRAPPQSEPSLSALFNEIRQTVEIEAQIISAVFPNPLVVMQTFLQRVFAQSVQAFVEVIMDKAMQIHAPRFVGAGGTIDAKTSAIEPNAVQPGNGPTTSHLAFLRALHMARSGALSLVNDLKLYDYRGAGIIAPSSAANGTNGAGGHAGADGAISDSMTLLGGDAVAAAGQLAGAAASPLAAMLDQSVEELFVPYMEGIRYIERESRSLADLYAGLLAKFISLHRATATAKKDKGFAGAGNTIFNRMRNQISANPDAASSSSSFGSASTAATANTAATSTASTSKTSFFKLSNLADRVRGTHTAGAAAGAAATTGQSGATAMSTEPSQDGSMTASRASLEDEVEDVDGELSLDVAEKMLRWHAESIGRCVDLSSASEVPKATFALLRVLTSAYIKTYIETALDSALAAVSAQDIRGATLPDVSSALSVVRSVEQVVSLWQHYVNTALVPLASTSVTLRREMVIFNNHNLLRVEGKCDALMQRVADNVVGFLANRLATQKKNDFVPKNDDLAFARQNTEPCVACSEALEKVEHAARMHLSPSLRLTSSTSGALRGSPGMASRPATSSRTRGVGSTDSGEAKRVSWSGVDEEEEDELQHSHLSRNAETLLTEIGVAFHGLLLDHLRKYTVSAAGGIMLTKDLALYQEAIGTFGISVVSDRFEMLRQLGNLFIVQASVLKSYMREGHLAKIDERLLRPYLLRRADYAREVRDLDDGPAPSTPTSASPDLFAQSAQGRDLFSHIPALISRNQPAARDGAAKTPEEQRLHRLAEVLAQLEHHTLAASKPQQLSADPAASTSK